MKNCNICGLVDEEYDEHSDLFHENTPKHIFNQILLQYAHKKKQWTKNRENMLITGKAELHNSEGAKIIVESTDKFKIRAFCKPGETIKFMFDIRNDSKNDDMLVIGFDLAHPQQQFKLNPNSYIFGNEPHVLEKKSSIAEEISVTFHNTEIGYFEMPIVFTFLRMRDKENLVFIREMVVTVEDNPTMYIKMPNYFKQKEWKRADHFIESTKHVPNNRKYKIPYLLKILLPRGLEERALEGVDLPPEKMQELKPVLIETRRIMDEGITKENYIIFFHHLLWWEEIIARINIRKFNMSGVNLKINNNNEYILTVPGLAEKRPSILRGDRIFLRPCDHMEVIFESIVKDLEDDKAILYDLDESFRNYYHENARFEVHFLMSYIPMERMHDAVSKLYTSKQQSRIFPEPNRKKVVVNHILKFYNPLIKTNEEQKSAVEHIVAGSSGVAPYIVFGPPGTGKTMTIVEAIIQLVVRNSGNRVMVCTDSNMASDHIALMLLQYNQKLHITNFLLRANAKSREWTVMPAELAQVSNGTNHVNCKSIRNSTMSSYRIVVATLSHAAKYASARNQQEFKLQMSHLFVDEAAQASEPSTLIPVTGLLAPKGQLVLAGDPKQLGPVCISREASRRGLGTSLLQRLKENYENLYTNDSNYITMLVKNFRSDPDILNIPNTLFYENNLQPFAKPDPLSRTKILDAPGGERAIVFHAVYSKEQRMGKAPSYFNDRELDMLKTYIQSLIHNHNVRQEDIGVIAPYIRQVYKMKSWLLENDYKIEVGTVESFQGKEKRVILVSTVRANCKLLDYDAKYGLGFLVDEKRFNVAITRAKAKIIIVGNPTCLGRDEKWRIYMKACSEFQCYFGRENQQIERTSKLLEEIAKTRFDKFRISEQLKKVPQETNKMLCNLSHV